MKWCAWALLALGLSGCGRLSTDFFPLELGQSRTFHVEAEGIAAVEDLVVRRRTSVEGHPGYELAGPMGVSRLGWVGGRLVAEQLTDTTLSPPLPILLARDGKADWEGVIVTVGTRRTGTATIEQGEDSMEVEGRLTKCRHVKIEMDLPDQTTIIEIWYAPRIGPVRWEQYSGGVLQFRANYDGGL